MFDPTFKSEAEGRAQCEERSDELNDLKKWFEV